MVYKDLLPFCRLSLHSVGCPFAVQKLFSLIPFLKPLSLGVLGTFVTDPLMVSAWVYFWAPSVPLASVSVFMPVPCRFEHYSFVADSEIRCVVPVPFCLRLFLAIQGLFCSV